MEIQIKTVIEWRLDIACQALEETLQDEEAVNRYLNYLAVKNEERKIQSLKDLGWRIA